MRHKGPLATRNEEVRASGRPYRIRRRPYNEHWVTEYVPLDGEAPRAARPRRPPTRSEEMLGNVLFYGFASAMGGYMVYCVGSVAWIILRALFAG